MRGLVLYQTLEDRDNVNVVERDGPFPCNHPTAWLGPGFYFWDTHISLAHWWGKSVHRIKGYFICQAHAIMDDLCWDLHGDGQCLLDFEKTCKSIVNQGLALPEELLVPQVIDYLTRTKSMPWKSIRALGMNSSTAYLSDRVFKGTIKFRKGNDSYLDLRPAVQVCLKEKRALSLSDFTVVYQSNFTENDFA